VENTTLYLVSIKVVLSLSVYLFGLEIVDGLSGF